MHTRQLGASPLRLSVVGLGCNNFGMRIDAGQAAKVVGAALDVGINHFDTAESYGGGNSEVFLGTALGSRRDDAIIATKFAPRPTDEPYVPGALRRRIKEGCETSLNRLGTDRIDLYYQHRPDPEAPIDEALEALTELVAEGKVVCAACSNYTAEQIEEAARLWAGHHRTPFVAAQFHWNLLARDVEDAIVPTVRRQNMGIIPFFPLEAGLLTGKYRLGNELPEGSRLAAIPRYAALASPENLAYVEELATFAETRGHTLLELAFGWLAAQEGVASVIAGATTPEQVRQNATAGQAWQLSTADLEAVPRKGPAA
jgi:aryl-alcohol dehydrogenase-like predicted oxidoreductase